MKRTSIMAATAVALLTLVASCSRENTGREFDPKGTSSVMISLNYPNSDSSRADAEPIADGTDLELKAGHILFCDASGEILKHVGIDNTVGSQNFTVAEISVDPLQTGEAVVRDLPNTVVRAHLISNDVDGKIGSASGITTNLEGTDIDDVLDYMIQVGYLNNSDGDVANVALYGKGDINFMASGTTPGGKKFSAAVTLDVKALATRLQIKKVSAKDFIEHDPADLDPSDGLDVLRTTKIDSYTIEGIYVNFYFGQDKLGPEKPVDIMDLVNNGSVVEKYSTTDPLAPYATGNAGETMADYLNIPASGSPLSVVPATKSVWAYNLFPGNAPHVIVRFSELTVSQWDATGTQIGTPVTITDPRFITVNGFLFDGGGSVSGFEANHIYTIDDIAFDYDDVTEEPEQEPLDVLVRINLMPWKDHSIVWDN